MIELIKELEKREIEVIRMVFALDKGKQISEERLKPVKEIIGKDTDISRIGDTFRLFEMPPVVNGLYCIGYKTKNVYYIVVSVADERLAFCYAIF